MIEDLFPHSAGVDPSLRAHFRVIKKRLHLDAGWLVVLHEVEGFVEEDEPERFKIIA